VLTLVESAKLSQDMLRRGVIETIIEDSPIFNRLPFLTIEGNSYKYNQETTLGNASFYPVNGVWVESTGTVTQKTANLSILGGDADVDNFIQRTRSDVNNQMALQTRMKAKAVGRAYETAFITGDVDADSNAFDGIRELTPAGQVLEGGTSGAALTLTLLDQLIDLIKGGKPDILLMSKRTRLRLKVLLAASSHYVESGTDAFGRQVIFYDGIPVEVSDFMPNDETGSVGGTALSSVYAIHFSSEEGLTGLHNGDIETIDIGQLESKDATRVRLRWYTSLALLRDSAIARLRSVNNS
jgi:hypothetical protein